MATVIWQGDVGAVAQHDRITIDAVAEQTYTLTIDGSVVTYDAEADDVKEDIANGLVAAVNATAAPPQFRRLRAEKGEPSAGNYTVELYARTPGEPFTLTAGSDLTKSSIDTSTGPNYASVAANWGGTLPQAGDTVVFRDTSVSCLYGLDALTALTFAEVRIEQSFTGQIGLPDVNRSAQDAPFTEYRGTHLELGATLLNIGEGAGQGSPLIRLNLVSVTSTIVVRNSGEPVDDQAAVQLKNSGASSTIMVTKGSVDVAHRSGETATITTARVSCEDSPETDARVRFGSGVTLGTVIAEGGAIEINGATTAVTASAGTVTVKGGAQTAITLSGTASVDYRGTGTCTTLTLNGTSAADFSADIRAKTVKNCTVQRGTTLNDPAGCVTFTNGIIFDGCRLAEVKIDVGVGQTITV